MNQPLVSIIIPTYNRAHLIGETLDSVLAQTYTNWECIVVDDGSTDGTDVLLQKYIKQDARFQYHHRPKDRPKGANACRNYGFEISRGEYIQWFDSDDILFREGLAYKIKAIRNDFDIVICSFEILDANQNISKYNTQLSSSIRDSIFQGIIKLNLQSFTFKRTSILNYSFDENLKRAQDLDFIAKVLLVYNFKVKLIPIALLRIRLQANSITTNFKKYLYEDVLSEIEVRRRIFKIVEIDLPQYKKKALKNYLMSIRLLLFSKPRIIYFKNIVCINEITIYNKAILFYLGVVYLILGKGLSSYSKMVRNICDE